MEYTTQVQRATLIRLLLGIGHRIELNPRPRSKRRNRINKTK